MSCQKNKAPAYCKQNILRLPETIDYKMVLKSEELRSKAFLLAYILVGMEPTHIVRRCFVGPIDLHLLVQPVGQHQAVYDG